MGFDKLWKIAQYCDEDLLAFTTLKTQQMSASWILAPNNIVLTILGEPEANWLTFGEF